MKRLYIFLIPILFGCASCGLNKNLSVNGSYAPKTNTQIVHSGQTLPEGLKRIGSITVGDTGFTITTNCSYESCIQAIISEAGKSGADVVYIVRIKEPNSELGGSTCYTITADLYVKE